MEDTQAEKIARLVLERYNEQKERQRLNLLTAKENIFKAVMHQVYIEQKEDSSFVIDETTFFREIGKQCHILQPKAKKETPLKKAKRKVVEMTSTISENLRMAQEREKNIIDWEHDRGVSDDVLEDLGHRIHVTRD